MSNKITKEKMSYFYATLLFSNTSNGFFKQLNRLIVRNWSLRALEEIKKKAWALAEELSKWEKTANSKPKTKQEIASFDKHKEE